MQKAERLLDLAAFLLRAAEPVSWRDIQEQFPEDYAPKSEEASIRKFERDKAELLELGIPIRYVQGDEDLPAGYVIDKDEFYLPDLKLPPEDLALLYLAGSVALAQGGFPFQGDLEHAMNKLSFAARAAGAAEPAAAAARQLSQAEPDRALADKLERLGAAVAAKKRLHLDYAGAERGKATSRDVDPYGLYQQQGAWFLVGHCHLRKDLRTFHLDRILALEVNAHQPRSADFAPPRGFSLAELATREPWEYAIHPPVRCAVKLDHPLSAEAGAIFGARAAVEEAGDGVLVTLAATNAEALVRHVLSLGEKAELVKPAKLRKRAKEVLAQLAKRVRAP